MADRCDRPSLFRGVVGPMSMFCPQSCGQCDLNVLPSPGPAPPPLPPIGESLGHLVVQRTDSGPASDRKLFGIFGGAGKAVLAVVCATLAVAILCAYKYQVKLARCCWKYEYELLEGHAMTNMNNATAIRNPQRSQPQPATVGAEVLSQQSGGGEQLPHGWAQKFHEGRPYYVDPYGQSHWERPAAPAAIAPRQQQAASLPAGWSQQLHEGRPYYIDPYGKSHWTPPTGAGRFRAAGHAVQLGTSSRRSTFELET